MHQLDHHTSLDFRHPFVPKQFQIEGLKHKGSTIEETGGGRTDGKSTFWLIAMVHFGAAQFVCLLRSFRSILSEWTHQLGVVGTFSDDTAGF